LEIPFAWDEPKNVTFVEICEDITKSQRIEKVEILIKKKETWERAGLAEAVGHKKIFKIQEKGIQGLKVRVLEARESIHIKNIAIYEENGE
jgi:alpha-L-fucosidase